MDLANQIGLNRPAIGEAVAGVPYPILEGPLPNGGPGTAALAQALDIPGAYTEYAAAGAMPDGMATSAALGIPAPGLPGSPNPAPINANRDPWIAAFQKAQLLNAYINNANFVAGKSNQFRTEMVGRLRQIYFRLIPMATGAGPAVANAAQAQAALVALINEINAAGQMSPSQSQAMADLANQLQQINIPQMLNGLIAEINALAAALGVNAENLVAQDNGPVPLTGGRKKTQRRKRKGGFKFTRMANSKRSLRMATRKRKSRKGRKGRKGRKKRKRTKRRRRR